MSIDADTPEHNQDGAQRPSAIPTLTSAELRSVWGDTILNDIWDSGNPTLTYKSDPSDGLTLPTSIEHKSIVSVGDETFNTADHVPPNVDFHLLEKLAER